MKVTPKPTKKSRSRATNRRPASSSRRTVTQIRASRPNSVERRRVKAAIKRLDEAQRIAIARADDLLAVAQDIGQAATAKLRDDIVVELIKNELLRDIASLHAAYAAHAEGGLPQAF